MVGFGGRPDAYNDQGEIWELKSFSAQTGSGYRQAENQLIDYIQSSGELFHRGNAVNILGARLEVNFTVSHWGGDYDVSIRADINGTDTGLLFYTYERKQCGC